MDFTHLASHPNQSGIFAKVRGIHRSKVVIQLIQGFGSLAEPVQRKFLNYVFRASVLAGPVLAALLNYI